MDSPGQTSTLTVRAHHLACLAHYAAFGGDHPTLPALLQAAREDPDRPARVVVGPDDICLPCPHWDGERCNRKPFMEEQNRAKDALFLAALGLDDRERPFREIYRLVAERVTLELLQAVCPTCCPAECAEAVARWPLEK